MNIILSLVAAFCAIQTVHSQGWLLGNDTLVQVPQGWLQGRKRDSVIGNTKYYSFEKIPYAEPPVGPLRFKAPKEAKAWEGIRDATALGPMCPQYNPLTDTTNVGSEDCLTVNVYTPYLQGRLPVLVIISGFAHFFDGDVVGLYEPDFLVNNTVVVTFNYRKDVFGFLNLGTKDVPGNAALKDQALLLKWVKNNIGAFGGDPNRVILLGISSGSASVSHHMMSPMSTGLFQGAIMMSGVPFCDPIYPHEVQKQSIELGKKFGIETDDADELLTELQAMPYEQLINSSYAMAMEDKNNVLFKKMSTFVPVVEEDLGQERFIEEDPMASMDRTPLNPVELLIGYCDKEALFVVKESEEYLIDMYRERKELLVPNKILWEATPEDVEKISDEIKNQYFGDKDISVENIKEFIEMLSYAAIKYDVITFAKKISPSIDTYLFEFKTTSNRNVYGRVGLQYGIEAASHGDLLGYLFPLTLLNLTVDVDSQDFALIKQFVDPIINFAVTGNPSDQNISWRKFTPQSLDYVEFSDHVTAKQNPSGEHIKFWDEIYEGNNPKFV